MRRLWIAAFTSIWTAVVAVIAIVCLALILIFALRLSRSVLPRLLAPISTIGYAAPGAILGLGILIAFAWFDHAVADVVFWLFGLDIGLLLTGSAAGVICAYVIRFFRLGEWRAGRGVWPYCAQSWAGCALARRDPGQGFAPCSYADDAYDYFKYQCVDFR